MIFVYCTRPSYSARDLVNKINELQPRGAKRITRPEGYIRTLARGRTIRPTRGDLVVNWGSSIPAGVLAGWNAGGVRVMNPNIRHGKYAMLQRLNANEIRVPPHALHRGQGRWLARLNSHQEANDLLANLERGDYYVQFVPNTEDIRIHILGGLSIRAGRKVPRNNNPHPEFRSWQAGWKIVYDGEHIRPSHRELARRAVEVLGLDFGAVDLGLTNPGNRGIVWEVNTAPGIEGRTLEVYAQKFIEIERATIR